MQSRGVEVCEAPREEPYGAVAVFQDRYGNKWDLIERKKLTRRDRAIREELAAFVARRKEEGGAPTDF